MPFLATWTLVFYTLPSFCRATLSTEWLLQYQTLESFALLHLTIGYVVFFNIYHSIIQVDVHRAIINSLLLAGNQCSDQQMHFLSTLTYTSQFGIHCTLLYRILICLVIQFSFSSFAIPSLTLLIQLSLAWTLSETLVDCDTFDRATTTQNVQSLAMVTLDDSIPRFWLARTRSRALLRSNELRPQLVTSNDRTCAIPMGAIHARMIAARS